MRKHAKKVVVNQTFKSFPWQLCLLKTALVVQQCLCHAVVATAIFSNAASMGKF